jgi:hypothetical protein
MGFRRATSIFTIVSKPTQFQKYGPQPCSRSWSPMPRVESLGEHYSRFPAFLSSSERL